MTKKFNQKELKAIIKAFDNSDLEAIKGYITDGFDPNEILTIKKGNIFDENNPYTVYDYALNTQTWYLTFILETKKYKEQKAQLEIIKYITPLITSAYPLSDGRSYTWRAFFGAQRSEDKRIGMFDELLEAMLDSGYDIINDKGIFETIGLFGLDTVKKVIEKTGIDDGDSVYSAAYNNNVEVLNFLLDKKVPVNKPFNFSVGGVSTALHEVITGKEEALVKRLLEMGADVSVKNIYGQTCLEWAKTHELSKEILDLLGKMA
ncbi:hypothetical protein FACS1894159_00690 [Bacteroidia bacterium]|nr:hypothetical protein FACS1894159_00690 [Bacteroidia bacterium]